jgi:hypothetical protein
MIGTAGAVHGGGAAEFRHDQHRSLQPQGSQIIHQCAQRSVEAR